MFSTCFLKLLLSLETLPHSLQTWALGPPCGYFSIQELRCLVPFSEKIAELDLNSQQIYDQLQIASWKSQSFINSNILSAKRLFYLWYLEMWQVRACLVLQWVWHTSQTWPSVWKCLASRCLLARENAGQVVWQKRQSTFPSPTLCKPVWQTSSNVLPT